MKTKFIFITGGVLSSLGKGLSAASIGALLKTRGLTVTIQKLDPYINVDPGTMNPYQHGEVYVTDDGAETDLDLGHYERYLNTALSQKNNTTSGSIYYKVITKERHGDYLGGTVQVIPHITDEIKNAILSLAKDEPENPAPDVAIIEIGGTVGDIEGLPFLEAIRQLRSELGRDNCLYIHLTLVPYLRSAGEHKTKPTQHSVKELRSIGIQPDIILCRCEEPVPADLRAKIALFCNVDKDAVFSAVDVSNIYELPLKLYEEGLDQKVAIMLRLPARNAKLEPWEELVHNVKNPQGRVTIAIVGKYVELPDAYLSIVEALTHGGIAHHAKVRVEWIAAEEVTPENVREKLAGCSGVLVPGGFGERGLEGKIAAVQYARENNVPFLGICLGMQMAVVEYARHVLGLTGAHTSEVDPNTPYPVIDLMPDQQNIDEKGGTMRLGKYPCRLNHDSISYAAYGEENIFERHRHRYEFNNVYRDKFVESGMRIGGVNPDRDLVEIVELPNHPWFVGVQYHPELKSRPNRPHPLFREFVGAALAYQDK